MQAATLIVIPTFNESENIGPLVERLLTGSPEVEVLVVDDGSPDGTARVVQEQQRRFQSRLHLLQRSGKGGRGSAVLEGFRFGLKRDFELFFEMDADFSHNPEEIPRFREKIEAGYDMVLGSRYLPESRIFEWGWKRTFFSHWANRYARLILGIPISDYTNGYRCYRRQAVAALDMDRIDARGYVVLSEVAYQLFLKGFRLGEVPTVFVNRRRGISNLSGHEVREAFLSVLRIRRAASDLRRAAAHNAAGRLGG